MLIVNATPRGYEPGMTIGELARAVKPDADVLVRNGCRVGPDTLLLDGDHCALVKTGEIPTALEMDRMLTDGLGHQAHRLLNRSTVAILGLGAIGFAVATSLVRLGLAGLILCDREVVIPEDLHRGGYFIDQIGQPRVEALKKTLVRINPFVNIILHAQLPEVPDFSRIFIRAKVLCDCLDGPDAKASIQQAVLRQMPRAFLVSAQAAGGHGGANTSACRKISNRIFVIHDGGTPDSADRNRFAPSAGITAHLMADQVLRLLLGQEE